MSEIITQTRYEDAIANTNDFLNTERGASLDGGFAARNVADRVKSVGEVAEDILTSAPVKEYDKFYVSVGRLSIGDNVYNGGDFDQAVSALPGHVVLVPGRKGSDAVFYPAAVSEDGLKTGSLRLHVLGQPYREKITSGTSIILSGAGQSETKGVGGNEGQPHDGIEAEHFPTLLAAGSDSDVRADWINGKHINHTWRDEPGNSVTTEVTSRLFGAEIPQKTITITRAQVVAGKIALLWHEGMRDEQTNRPETTARTNGLVVMQALSFDELRTRNPNAIDNVKELIA